MGICPATLDASQACPRNPAGAAPRFDPDQGDGRNDRTDCRHRRTHWFFLLESQEPTVNDLSTYALCCAAALVAAIAVAGLIISTAEPATPASTVSAEPQSVVVQSDARIAATMNIPF